MKGRPPTPLPILQARGSRLDRREDDPVGIPIENPEASIPAWLSAGSREHWMILAPMLKDMGVLMRSDTMMLGILCDTFVDYITSRDNGDAARCDKARVYLKSLAEKFALTPVDRGRVSVEPKKYGGIEARKRA